MNTYKKASSTIPGNNATISTAPKKDIVSNIVKWIPLLFAGAAVGVSILALKEIKNVRKELISLKKESMSNVKENQLGDPEFLKRIELMDEQIRKISKYLASMENNQGKNNGNQANSNSNQANSNGNQTNSNGNIQLNKMNIKKVINEEPEPEIKVKTEEKIESKEQDDEEEYEYEEVTDDES
jgi:hypothetical protein